MLADLRDITRRAFCFALGMGLARGARAASRPRRWAVVYAERVDSFALADYDIVVLDSDRHPPLAPITERGRWALSYLSLTQVGRHRTFFKELSDAGLVRTAHPIWTDAHYLDVRRPEWAELVIEKLIPQALDRGFTGLFLDTLDDAEFLETSDPRQNGGARQAAVRLVRTIRQQYPALKLMMNRGFALLPELATTIDVILGESVVTTFDGKTKAPARASAADAKWQIDALNDALVRNPALTVCTLDYWDPADREGVRRLYTEQRQRGFVPYVSTPALDRLVPEP